MLIITTFILPFVVVHLLQYYFIYKPLTMVFYGSIYVFNFVLCVIITCYFIMLRYIIVFVFQFVFFRTSRPNDRLTSSLSYFVRLDSCLFIL